MNVFNYLTFFFATINAIHLSYQPPNGMGISWYTSENIHEPTLKLFSSQTDDTPIQTVLCRTVGGIRYYMHHCIVSDLQYQIIYFYQLTDNANNYYKSSEIKLQFQMVNPEKTSFTIMQIGDTGIDTKLLDAIHKRTTNIETDFDLLFHLGDISYADDRDKVGKNPDYITNWTKFADMISNTTSIKPYMVCPGNHDITCHMYGDLLCPDELRNFTTFRNWFQMPNSIGPNLWYSFDYGEAHFTFINTESDYPNAPTTPKTIFNPSGGGFGDQIKWLKNDLSKTNKKMENCVRTSSYIYSNLG